jgi:protein-tyrosine phosphatase
MTLTPPSRLVPHPLVFNLRDVGGYVGHDGRTVRWRRLLRSDSLHRLSLAEPEFAALGVRTVIDLRRGHEVATFGRVPQFDGLVYHHIAPEHAEWDAVPLLPEDDSARWLADRYLDLARDGIEGLARVMKVIADADAAPVVVHCAAGKDRTGVVCALTLSVLGVSDEDIAEDYALSTAASARFTAWLKEANPNARDLPQQMLSSPAGAMLLFLADLRTEHGSIEGYLTGAGVRPADLTALREHLLAEQEAQQKAEQKAEQEHGN